MATGRLTELGAEPGTEAIARFTRALIAQDSDSQSEGNPGFLPAATTCIDLVADALREARLDVEVFRTATGHPTIAAVLEGRGHGRTLVLNGHVDVVPAGDPDGWRHDPWAGAVEDGILYGRGAADMKGGVAAMVFALRALAAAGWRPEGSVVVHVVSDEEIAGTGSREAMTRTGSADGVISCEPTDLDVVTVHGGLVHLRVEVDGVAAHAGERYTTVRPGYEINGVNAIEKAMLVVGALRDLERAWGDKAPTALLPPGFNTISPGIFLAGPGGGRDGRLDAIGNPGTIPDYAAVEFNIWYLPTESRDAVAAEVEAAVTRVACGDEWLRDRPPRLSWGFNGLDVPAASIAAGHPLVESLSSAGAAAGRRPDIVGFTAASELGWYAQRGIPGVLYGPGRIKEAHGVDEHVAIADVAAAARAVALTCEAFCGSADEH